MIRRPYFTSSSEEWGRSLNERPFFHDTPRANRLGPIWWGELYPWPRRLGGDRQIAETGARSWPSRYVVYM